MFWSHFFSSFPEGIKGPKRSLCIPFGNMDQENVAQRKKFLDNYLKVSYRSHFLILFSLKILLLLNLFLKSH